MVFLFKFSSALHPDDLTGKKIPTLTNFRKIHNEFFDMLQAKTKRLSQDKKELLKEKEFWAVNELHRQMIEIGEFLSKVGR
jgi:hypothetical protein